MRRINSSGLVQARTDATGRAARCATFVLAALISLVLTGSALASDGIVDSGETSSATELSEPVAATVEETSAPVTKTVAETLAPVTKTVEETTAPVTKTVEETVAPVTKTVEETVAPVTKTEDAKPVGPASSFARATPCDASSRERAGLVNDACGAPSLERAGLLNRTVINPATRAVPPASGTGATTALLSERGPMAPGPSLPAGSGVASATSPSHFFGLFAALVALAVLAAPGMSRWLRLLSDRVPLPYIVLLERPG